MGKCSRILFYHNLECTKYMAERHKLRIFINVIPEMLLILLWLDYPKWRNNNE